MLDDKIYLTFSNHLRIPKKQQQFNGMRGMDKTFKITLNLLTEKVKENLTKIQNNQKRIRDLKTQQDSELKEEKLKKKLSINHKLLTENIDLIKVQLAIANLLEKNEEILENVNISDAFRDINDCMEITINGLLVYSNSGRSYFSEEKSLVLT